MMVMMMVVMLVMAMSQSFKKPTSCFSFLLGVIRLKDHPFFLLLGRQLSKKRNKKTRFLFFGVNRLKDIAAFFFSCCCEFVLEKTYQFCPPWESVVQKTYQGFFLGVSLLKDLQVFFFLGSQSFKRPTRFSP